MTLQNLINRREMQSDPLYNVEKAAPDITKESGLKTLISLCKGAVLISINDHKSSYMPVLDYLKECSPTDVTSEIDGPILEKIVELDALIELQFYPNTPVGFYTIYHFDIDEAIECALKICGAGN